MYYFLATPVQTAKIAIIAVFFMCQGATTTQWKTSMSIDSLAACTCNNK